MRLGSRREWAGQAVLLVSLTTLVVVLSMAVLGQSEQEKFLAKLCPDSLELEAEVFMRVDATDAEIAGVRSFLSSSQVVASFVYLDKQGAYKEFVRIFRKTPDLIQNTTADALPTSFRIVPIEPDDISRIKRATIGLAGVDEVAVPDRALNELCEF